MVTDSDSCLMGRGPQNGKVSSGAECGAGAAGLARQEAVGRGQLQHAAEHAVEFVLAQAYDGGAAVRAGETEAFGPDVFK